MLQTPQDILVDFSQPSIGQKVWQVCHQLGSMIKFEVGEKVGDEQDEFHFWISCCHWWLHQGEKSDFEDIVCSESNKQKISEKLAILEGKKLLNIHFNPADASTFMDFEDNLFLQLSPYDKNEYGDKTGVVISLDKFIL